MELRPPPEQILPRLQRRIYLALRDAGSAGLCKRELVEKLYGDRPDGGPEYVGLTITITIGKMHERLAPYGLVLVARPPTGSRSRRYLENKP